MSHVWVWKAIGIDKQAHAIEPALLRRFASRDPHHAVGERVDERRPLCVHDFGRQPLGDRSPAEPRGGRGVQAPRGGGLAPEEDEQVGRRRREGLVGRARRRSIDVLLADGDSACPGGRIVDLGGLGAERGGGADGVGEDVASLDSPPKQVGHLGTVGGLGRVEIGFDSEARHSGVARLGL